MDSPESDLPSLLAAGEHAAFHGKPSAAADALEQAVELAQSLGLVAEACAAAWLHGVALGAGGRYGSALSVLGPLAVAGGAAGAPVEQRLFGSLSGSTAASVQRQLGRHAVARELDLVALTMTDGSGEAAYDAQLGLVSDAVGLDDVDEAARRLAEAEGVIPGHGDEWWRQRVRLGWARAEVANADGRAEEAADHAQDAVKRAEDARAPRHVAKGLLLLGLAQVGAGRPEATATLRRSAMFADSLGVLPIIWPARALLGALLSEEAASQVEASRSLASARAAVLTIAGDLPDDLRADWLDRPDVSALLSG